jgi:hypothetical protein
MQRSDASSFAGRPPLKKTGLANQGEFFPLFMPEDMPAHLDSVPFHEDLVETRLSSCLAIGL